MVRASVVHRIHPSEFSLKKKKNTHTHTRANKLQVTYADDDIKLEKVRGEPLSQRHADMAAHSGASSINGSMLELQAEFGHNYRLLLDRCICCREKKGARKGRGEWLEVSYA